MANLSENTTNLQEVLDILRNKAAGGGSASTNLEWISCASLPTSYAADPEGTNYYIELPSRQCFVLFYGVTNTDGAGSHMGCFDVSAETYTVQLYHFWGSNVSGYIVEEVDTLYLCISSPNMPSDTYYAILPTPSI